MQKIAESPPEAIAALLERGNAESRLLRRPGRILEEEDTGFLHLHLEIRLTAEGISRVEEISETLFHQSPVESCFHLGGDRQLLILAAFRSVHEASTWVALVQSQILGIADTYSQFLHSSYQQQGYMQVWG